MGTIARATYCTFVLLFVASIKVKGRPLRYNSHVLVSDGIDDVHVNQSSYLLLKGLDASEECEQMYGFLPCSNNIFGHLFLIVVYEYMMFHGESYVARGGEQIFKILGPGVFGASAFQVIGALPESLILLASGLLNSKETAQEYVYTSVGLVAGSTILLLTLVWGTCVIAGCKDLSNTGSEISLSDGSNSRLSFKELSSSFSGSGIVTDLETSYTARVMVLSVIPFLIVQLPKIFPSSSGQQVAILIALIVSVVLLLLYFIYQIFQPWIQKRRLEYVKHEHVILKVLEHVQKHALGRILTDDGAPNVNSIRRLFEGIDQDGDDAISALELREILLDVKFSRTHINKDKAIAEVIKEFDLNRDGKITKDEFVNAFTKWLHETKNTMDKQNYSTKSLKDVYQVFQPWIQSKRKEHEMKKNILSEMVKHVQTNAIGSLLKEDGTPDTTTIKRLFENIDNDGDDFISEAELKEIIVDIKFGKVPLNADEAVAKVIEELDTSRDRKISEDEFVTGITKWLNTSENQTPPPTNSQHDFYQKTWEETDKLMDDESNGVVDNSLSSWFKAIMFLVSGVAILSVLAEPLIYSVQHFSEAAGIPSFFISFILVPLATNARIAISAITAAHRKKPRTTSLTFCELYGGVFMTNLLGFCVLLSLIYVRGLTWVFSAEVLVVIIVCSIVGLVASFRSTFSIWTSVVAYMLYPLSLLLVYVLDDVLNYV